MRHGLLAALAVGLAVLPAGAEERQAGPTGKAKPAQHEDRQQDDRLPAGARMLLLERMGNHRMDMERLTQAVLLLEHDAVVALAERLAGEPRLGRQEKGEDALNSMVPPAFFELQDELRERARTLARAARSGDDERIARAYGKVAETCVRCHATYLNRQD